MIKTFNITTYTITPYTQTIRSIPHLPLHYSPYTICTIKHQNVHLQSIFKNRGNPMLFMNSFPRSNIMLHTWELFSRIGEIQCYLYTAVHEKTSYSTPAVIIPCYLLTVSHEKTSNLQIFDKNILNCYREIIQWHFNTIYPELVLFEQSNCIDWICVCYITEYDKAFLEPSS